MEKTRRLIRKYQKKGEELIEEIVLPDINLEDMRMIFGELMDNPMYDSYLITDAQKDYIEKIMCQRLDITEFDYFFETDKE